MSFLTVQAMRYAISGILPNQEGAHRALEVCYGYEAKRDGLFGGTHGNIIEL